MISNDDRDHESTVVGVPSIYPIRPPNGTRVRPPPFHFVYRLGLGSLWKSTTGKRLPFSSGRTRCRGMLMLPASTSAPKDFARSMADGQAARRAYR